MKGLLGLPRRLSSYIMTTDGDLESCTERESIGILSLPFSLLIHCRNSHYNFLSFPLWSVFIFHLDDFMCPSAQLGLSIMYQEPGREREREDGIMYEKMFCSSAGVRRVFCCQRWWCDVQEMKKDQERGFTFWTESSVRPSKAVKEEIYDCAYGSLLLPFSCLIYLSDDLTISRTGVGCFPGKKDWLTYGKKDELMAIRPEHYLWNPHHVVVFSILISISYGAIHSLTFLHVHHQENIVDHEIFRNELYHLMNIHLILIPQLEDHLLELPTPTHENKSNSSHVVYFPRNTRKYYHKDYCELSVTKYQLISCFSHSWHHV